MSEEGAENELREGSFSLPARVEQTRVGSASVVAGLSFALAIVLPARNGSWLKCCFQQRAAARTGIRVAAFRLRALSQIERRGEPERTVCLFSSNHSFHFLQAYNKNYCNE